MIEKCAQRGLARCGPNCTPMSRYGSVLISATQGRGHLRSVVEAIAGALSTVGSMKWLQPIRSPWMYN